MKKVEVDFGCYSGGGRKEAGAYKGMNPKFVEAVWKKRRKQAAEDAIREANELAQAEKAAMAKARADRKALGISMKQQAIAEKAFELAKKIQAEEIAKIKKIMSLPGGMAAASIITETAQKYDLSYDDIIKHSRSKTAYAARQAAIAAVVKAFPQMSLPELGRTFNRHHASILHAIRGAGIVRATDEHSHKLAA